MNILEKNINDKEYWLSLCPGMSISDAPFKTITDAVIQLDSQRSDQCESRILDEGYFVTEQVFKADAMKLIADSIKILSANNYPAAFIFIFDEPWQIFGRLAKIYKNILGESYQLRIGGIWAWNLEDNNQGFEPHRDSNINENIKTGKPTNLTVWVPVTDADADNGCMYVLPLNLDPNYPNNLTSIQINKPKDIRAVPAPAGSVLAWIQNIIHWGGTSSSWAKEPRLSIAASFSSLETGRGSKTYINNDINSPALALEAATIITLTDRLQIIASAIWYYGNKIFTSYPLAAEELFEFSRQHVSAETRIQIDNNFDEVILKSQQHKSKALFLSKQFDQALPVFEKLCISHPMDVKYRMALGLTLKELDRKDEALQHLHHALELQPDNTNIQHAIRSIENS